MAGRYAPLADRLVNRAQVQVLALYDRHKDGHLTAAEFGIAAAHVMVAAQVQAEVLADVALAARLTQLTGRSVQPLGGLGG